MPKNRFYVTTAIDYTNDVIHIGHAYQKVAADVLARYHRLIGDETFFLTGTDEHGSSSEQAAKRAGKEPKEFVDEISARDKEQIDSLNISYDRFIRTTDSDHVKTVGEFYRRVQKTGDIYKGKYSGLYCVSCESYKTESEIIDGHCAIHPTKELEKVTEENYFFKWKKYESFLKDHIRDNPEFIQPEGRRKEILAFLDQGLEDITISRNKEKVGWGIPVPGDTGQVIYVWFDALINYISGAPDFWPADVHILGKDNLRWHALLWPAMLKSAGYELPKTIYAHGFLSLDGKKISKTLGNVIRPTELVNKFSPNGNQKLGADVIRYYLLKFGPQREDSDLSIGKIKEVYNADLANGLGNLVSRVAKLCENAKFEPEYDLRTYNPALKKQVSDNLGKYNFEKALAWIWNLDIKWGLKWLDQNINEDKPWEIKDKKILNLKLHLYVTNILDIAHNLWPFLPATSEKIKEQFLDKKIVSRPPLFPRLG